MNNSQQNTNTAERPQNDIGNKRMEICRRCKYLTQKQGMNICSLCGCVVENKTAVLAQKCPSGYW